MAGVRRGINTDGNAALVIPDDGVAGFDSDTTWLESGRSYSDGSLAGRLGSDLGIIGGAIWCPFLGSKEKVIDRGIDETADDQINNYPLPHGAFTVTCWIIHELT